jgi:hypothetical protein
MRRLLLLSLALLGVSGIISTHLWLELRSERRSVAHEPELSDGSMAPLVYRSDQGPSASSARPAEVSSEPTKTIEVGDIDVDVLDPEVAAAVAQLQALRNPKYRSARLAQIRANKVQAFPGLAEELQLSEVEAAKLFDLLAEHQLDAHEANYALIAAKLEGSEYRSEARLLQQSQQENLAKMLQASLGAAKYQEWTKYTAELPERTKTTNRMRALLSGVGQPPSDAQLQAVASAVVREQSRREEAMKTLVQESMNGRSVQSMQDEWLRLQEESNQRVLASAAPYLTSDQFNTLRSHYEQEAAKARSDLQRQQLGNGQ